MRVFHEDNKLTGQANNKVGQIGWGGSTKPTAGCLIGYKARVLPSPTLNTVVQEVLARAVTQERRIKAEIEEVKLLVNKGGKVDVLCKKYSNESTKAY